MVLFAAKMKSKKYSTIFFVRYSQVLAQSIQENKFTFLLLSFIWIVGLLLRTVYLGNSFESSDNIAVPFFVMMNEGYSWMPNFKTGTLSFFIVKIFTGTLSELGISINEFLWKFPIAFISALTVPLTYILIRAFGFTRRSGFSAAALTAVYPVHIMQGRYSFGHETLGTFFLMTSLLLLHYFLSKPGFRRGIIVSISIAVYLVSHHYIIPFVIVFPAALVLLGDHLPEVKILCPKRF